MSDENPYRLTRSIEPSRYELTLTPDLPGARFAGEEKVSITVKEPSSVIRLNAAELDILSAEVVDGNGNRIAGQVTLDEDAEVATISLDSRIEPGEWLLHLTFSGTLNDKLRGFYRSTFTDDEGNSQVIATTQFEATDARRAFPCWDEPDFKAVFSVTLIVEESLAAFSNAAVREQSSLENGKRQVEFEDTMKMSTYLVAFVVGPLVRTRTVDVDGVPLTVACVPGREPLGEFALEAGAAALRYLSGYFGIPYPGGKLDLIALPDFAFGAMENLGCVTFRETALLVDTTTASRLEIERVADVVGHEIAHMWFGDLVTMKWWNGIWLNEAFATFMELSFVHHFRPEWERWVSFGLSKSLAMGVDSLSTTRAIEFPVLRPEEAQGMFDLLTYEKGGSVLRMLEQHMGEEAFAAGISLYLNTHSYGNAETTDLWDALEQSSGQPIRALMDTWIFQGGHPILRVEPGNSSEEFVITQARFRFLLDEDPAKLWHVPVGIRAFIDGTEYSSKLLITEGEARVTLPGKPEWLLVNAGAHGFYRVSYAPALLQQLTAHLDSLSALEAFALINDTWAACVAGRAELRDFLQLLPLFRDSDDANVWSAMLAPLNLVDKVIADTDRGRLERFVRDLARPSFERLGWERSDGESDRDATLRGTIIGALGGLGADPDIRQEAARRYEAYTSDSAALDSNLVSPVEGVLAATNDAAIYDRLKTKFSSEKSTPQEKVNALQAMACFTEASLVAQTLEMIRTGQVRTQDAPYAVRVMLGRRQSGASTWAWCEDNWNDLMERLPDNSIARMVDGITAQALPELATVAREFLANHPVPQAQLNIDQTRERLLVNSEFYLRNEGKLAALFE